MKMAVILKRELSSYFLTDSVRLYINIFSAR